MKTHFIKNTLVITILIFENWNCFSQGFVNLDFENAVITPDPSSPYYPYAIYANDAIPGWTATGCFLGSKDILYNAPSLGSTSISILATNGTPPALDGAFSVFFTEEALHQPLPLAKLQWCPCPQNPSFLRLNIPGHLEELFWFL
jgi:hypothetical protein